MPSELTIRASLWPQLGVELRPLPTQLPLSPQTARLLRETLAQHHVVLLRNVPQPAVHQLNLTAALGRVVGVQRSGFGLRVAPELRLESDERINPYNLEWHSDTSWAAQPARFTLLYAERIAGNCSGTDLADTAAGYASLSTQRRCEIAQWQAFHHVTESRLVRFGDHQQRARLVSWAAVSRALSRRLRARRQEQRTDARPGTTLLRAVPPPGVLHSVVRIDAFTGKTHVQLGEHAYRLAGQSQGEGLQAIVQLTEQVTTKPVTHQWQQGDLLIFDNRLLLHRRTPSTNANPAQGVRELRRSLAWMAK